MDFKLDKVAIGKFRFWLAVGPIVGIAAVTFSIWFWYQAAQEGDKKVLTPKPKFGLDISEPEDGLVTNQKILTISGKTAAAALLYLTTDQDGQVDQADGYGDFSFKLNLADGLNQITIAAEDQGNEKSEILEVFYSLEKLE